MHEQSRQVRWWFVPTGRRAAAAAVVGVATLVMLYGCGGLQSPLEFIPGQAGEQVRFSDTPSAEVLSPQSDLAISGGTPVEVVWRIVARTRFSVVDVFLDPDRTPDNNNEILAFNNLPLETSTETLDTTLLQAGTYNVGVRIEEVGEIVAAGYAPGRLVINQRPILFFTSPRENFVFDRTARINPSFDVAWSVSDPDSTISTQIFLDPDETPNGNEVLLRTSDSQTGGSFRFDLPTANFEPGTYRMLALVSDGVDTFSYYAPGSIRLRGRLAGPIDLRDLHLPTSGIRGAIFEGFNPRDNAGSFVSSMGDIDGDGFSDFIVLSQFGKPRYQINVQRTGVGEAYMVYGRAAPFAGVINLNSTGALFRGEIFGGVPEVADPIRPTRGITSFTLLTDWDFDGIPEFAFGIPFTDSLTVALLDSSGYFRTGAVVVVSASSLRPDLGFPGRNVFNLADFGTQPHVVQSCTACFAPNPCRCPEGFYGPKAPPSLCPTTFYHRHVTSAGPPPPPPVPPGGARLGCRFSSNDFADQFGESIASYDFDSLIMCAPNRDPLVGIDRVLQPVPGAGLITVFFNEKKDGFYPWANDQGVPANQQAGYPGTQQSIDAAANALPHGGPYHYIMDDRRLFTVELGEVRWLVRFSPGYFVDSDDSEPCARPPIAGGGHMGNPQPTLRLWSNTPGARLSAVKGVRDVNADGLLDLIVGAPLAAEGAGACYIVFGRERDLVMGGELQVEELALPMNSLDPNRRRIFDGLRILGNPGDRLGQAQDSAGDFNGDGYADVIIGSPLLNNRQGGAVVFFGSRDVVNPTQTDIAFNDIPVRGLGVVVIGETEGDLAGARVAFAGDVDGDGNDDVLIAAPNRSVQLDLNGDGTPDIDRTNCGVVYLIYGSPNLRGSISLSQIGTEQLPGTMFIGRNSADFLGGGLGLQGDRSTGIAAAGDVDGDGAGDILIGSVSASPRDRAQAGEAYLLYGKGD